MGDKLKTELFVEYGECVNWFFFRLWFCRSINHYSMWEKYLTIAYSGLRARRPDEYKFKSVEENKKGMYSYLNANL